MSKNKSMKRHEDGNSQLARQELSRTELVRLAAEIDATEDDLYLIITVCSYIAVPNVPSDILRIQLSGLDAEMEARVRYWEIMLNQGGETVATARRIDEWFLIFTQIKDIRAGIDAALDPDNPDDGNLLRAALNKHMLPKDRQRHEAIRRAGIKRQQELEQERKAAVEQARQEIKQQHKEDSAKGAKGRQGKRDLAVDELKTFRGSKPRYANLSRPEIRALYVERCETLIEAGSFPTDKMGIYQHIHDVAEVTLYTWDF